MHERTAEEVAWTFSAAGDSVTEINKAKQSYETDDEYKRRIERNVVCLEHMKEYKKIDGTTSIWTTENFTAINSAITDGKAKYE